MLLDEFQETVKRRCPDKKLEPFLEVAIAERPSIIYTDQDVVDTIQRAGELFAEHEKWVPKVDVKEIFSGEPGPREIIKTDQIITALVPEVWSIREHIFGKVGAPFRSMKKAREWLLDEEKEEHRKIAGYYSRGVNPILARYLHVRGVRNSEISFQAPGKKVIRIPTLRQSTLDYLARSTEFMAKSLGVTQEDVLWWVLAGKKLVLPRFRVEHYQTVVPEHDRWGYTVPVSWIKLEIRASDLTWEELRSAYSEIKKRANMKRERLSRRSLKIFQLVRQHGGPPKEGIVAFWKMIRKQVQSEGFKVPENYRGIQRVYNDMVKESKTW